MEIWAVHLVVQVVELQVKVMLAVLPFQDRENTLAVQVEVVKAVLVETLLVLMVLVLAVLVRKIILMETTTTTLVEGVDQDILKVVVVRPEKLVE